MGSAGGAYLYVEDPTCHCAVTEGSIVTKVLYVEDNDDNIFMLKMRLELLGDFEVLTAEDGDDRRRRATASSVRRSLHPGSSAADRSEGPPGR